MRSPRNGMVATWPITRSPNSGATSMTDWRLQFTLPEMPLFRTRAALNLPSRARSTLLTPESYNGTPVDSITVGYQAAQTGGYSPPTNLLINGQAVTIDQTPITSSPTTPPPTTPPEIPTGGTVIST